MAIEVVPFSPAHVEQASDVIAGRVAALRAAVPALSSLYTDAAVVAHRLGAMNGAAALDQGTLVGVLTGWHPIPEIRRTQHVGAYVPDWAHAVWGSDVRRIYAALYRELATTWAAAG